MYDNLALSENGFLFDTQTGVTYSLNATGTFLLRELIDGTDFSELTLKLTEKFDVNNNVAERDLEQFLFRLKDLGLLQPESEES